MFIWHKKINLCIGMMVFRILHIFISIAIKLIISDLGYCSIRISILWSANVYSFFRNVCFFGRWKVMSIVKILILSENCWIYGCSQMTKRICNTLKWLFCGFQQMSFIRRSVARVKLEVIDEKSLKKYCQQDFASHHSNYNLLWKKGIKNNQKKSSLKMQSKNHNHLLIYLLL